MEEVFLLDEQKLWRSAVFHTKPKLERSYALRVGKVRMVEAARGLLCVENTGKQALSVEPKIPTLCTSQRPVRTIKRLRKYIILPVITCSI